MRVWYFLDDRWKMLLCRLGIHTVSPVPAEFAKDPMDAGELRCPFCYYRS